MQFTGRRVYVAGVDSIRKKKIKLYMDNRPDVQLFFIDSSVINSINSCVDQLGIYIIPHTFVSDLFPIDDKTMKGLSLFAPQVIGFGPVEAMAFSFMSGCNDYLCEPWEPEELYIRSFRCIQSESKKVGEGSLYMIDEHRLYYSNREECINLSKAESIIIRVLLRNKGIFINRETLGILTESRYEGRNSSRAIDMKISRLRSKIRSLCGDCPIRTSSGYGWTIDPDI